MKVYRPQGLSFEHILNLAYHQKVSSMLTTRDSFPLFWRASQGRTTENWAGFVQEWNETVNNWDTPLTAQETKCLQGLSL